MSIGIDMLRGMAIGLGLGLLLLAMFALSNRSKPQPLEPKPALKAKEGPDRQPVPVESRQPVQVPAPKPETSPAPEPESTPEIVVATNSDPKPGDTVTLADSNNNFAALTPTLADFAEYKKLALARDMQGMAQMVMAGQMYMIDSGTKARVIEEDYKSDCFRVRISEGDFSGVDGWVHFTEVHK